MSLKKIQIKNYKSIGNCTLDLDELTALLGENGTGKSNILSAVKYFYDNLISRAESYDIFDHYNPLNNRVEIALTFDLGKLKQYAYANLKRNEETQYQAYYKKIVYLSPGDSITVRMIKIKDSKIRWSHDLETRKMIAGLFPLYFVDARQIDLVNWDILWNHIGDLMKLENEVGKSLREKIRESIAGADSQLKKRLEKVESTFERRNIKVSQYTKNEFAAALSQMYFSGETYGFEENNLSEFSNGTNSFNFTCLLISILSIMAETKMKEPVMILDEPEISLHNKMIDSLAEIFYECRGKVKFLLASHSARLIKDILVQEGEENQIYQVYRRGNETKVSRFQMFSRKNEDRERFFITDQHASAYFAKSLLLVEGETELDVFQNRFLKAVFPKLGQVEVIKGMSDDVIYRIVSPKDRKYHIPVTILLDLDKIYTYQKNLEEKYFEKCKSGENYYFFKKGDSSSSSKAAFAAKRSRIYAMAKRCKFHYEHPLYTSTDLIYWEFVQLIKDYFREYGIFVARTTIEGMLVTEENLEIFMDFLKEYFPKEHSHIYPFDETLFKPYDRVPFVRLLLGGECDYGMGYKWLRDNSQYMDERLKTLIERNRIGKTSWAGDWLRYYFCRLAEERAGGRRPKDLRSFLDILEHEDNAGEIRQTFFRDFPELGQLVETVCQTA